MPCSDGMEHHYREQEKAKAVEEAKGPLVNELVLTSSVLCGMITAFGLETVVNTIPWNNTGTTKEEFLAWWEEHQKIDNKKG